MRNLMSVVLVAVMAAGCAQQCVQRQQDLTLDGVVAVIPFENLAGHPNAGIITAELFQAEMYTMKGEGIQLVLAEEVAAKLAPLEGKTLSPMELGKLLGAQYLVIGRVTEYMYKHGLGEDPAVGVSIRLVEARTGDVLWSGARSDTGRYSWIKQDGLSRLAQSMCHRLAESLLDR